MKLMLYNLDNCNIIDLGLSAVTILEIENRSYYLRLLKSFKGEQLDPIEVGLIEKEKFLDLEKVCSVILDYIDWDNASKSIITKLYNRIIEDSSSQIDLVSKFAELSQSMIRYIDNLTSEMDLNLEFVSQTNIKDCLQFVGLEPVNSANPCERLLDYISLIAELKLYKLLVLINPKSIFIDKEMTEIYKQALYKGVKLLIIENVHRQKKLEYETKVYLDEDYFDIKI